MEIRPFFFYDCKAMIYISPQHMNNPVLSVPMFNYLEIETQADCNRRCPTCLRQSYINKDNLTHKGRMPVTSKIGTGSKMPFDVFKSIVDQSIEMGFAGTVNLQHFNEPLLDERLPELASYVKNKPTIGEIHICTNMDLITEETAKDLDGVIDIFTISLYMPREKQVERERWIQSLFKKSHLNFKGPGHVITHYSPTDFVRTMATGDSYHNLENQNRGDFVDATGAPRDRHRGQDRVPETVEEVSQGVSEMPCVNYTHMLIVAYDGTILHCCEDYVGHFGLGNVNSMSLKDIWESETHRRLVEDLSHAGGRQKYSYCSNCPRY